MFPLTEYKEKSHMIRKSETLHRRRKRVTKR